MFALKEGCCANPHLITCSHTSSSAISKSSLFNMGINKDSSNERKFGDLNNNSGSDDIVANINSLNFSIKKCNHSTINETNIKKKYFFFLQHIYIYIVSIYNYI